MSNRDDFTEATKLQLAKRAGFECSFPECKIVTVGPSDESNTAVASIGKAAHICGAASGPGSRRYDPRKTSERGRRALWSRGISRGHLRPTR